MRTRVMEGLRPWQRRFLVMLPMTMIVIALQAPFAPKASAAVLAKDVATLRVGSGTMGCNVTACSFNVEQDQDDPGCVLELITISPSTIGTAHQDTFCSMHVEGTFATQVRNPNKPCTITPHLTQKP